MTTIRMATAADIPALMALSDHHERVMMKRPFHAPTMLAHWESLVSGVEAGTSIVLVAEREGETIGGFAGVFSARATTGERIFAEVHWMTRPDRPSTGIALMVSAQALAREGGAVIMLMGSPNDDVTTILEKSGYKPAMTIFEKGL